MKLTFEIEIPPVYIPQLRKLMHHCLDGAFDSADTNAGTYTISTETMFGKSTFVTKMDHDCIAYMQQCNKFHRNNQ